MSYKKSKTNYSSEDNGYKKNNGLVLSIPHKEEANNDSAKPFAKLLLVDDDSDLVQVLKRGF